MTHQSRRLVHPVGRAFLFLTLLILLPFHANIVSAQDFSCTSDGQVVQLRIENPIGSVSDYFSTILCDSSTSECNGLTVKQVVIPGIASSTGSTYTLVVMENFPTALEASLSYVADVRARYLQINGQTVSEGNPNAGVSASAIYLVNPTFSVPLFLEDPPNPYSVELKFFPSCPSNTGYWGFALIGVLPLALLAFRSPWSPIPYPLQPGPPGQMFAGLEEHPLPVQLPQALENVGIVPPPPQVPSAAPGASSKPKFNNESQHQIPQQQEHELLAPSRSASVKAENNGNGYFTEGIQYEVLEDGKMYEVKYQLDPSSGIVQTVYVDPETREEYYYA